MDSWYSYLVPMYSVISTPWSKVQSINLKELNNIITMFLLFVVVGEVNFYYEGKLSIDPAIILVIINFPRWPHWAFNVSVYKKHKRHQMYPNHCRSSSSSNYCVFVGYMSNIPPPTLPTLVSNGLVLLIGYQDVLYSRHSIACSLTFEVQKVMKIVLH